MADTNKMNNKGTAVVYLPVGDTSGICWKKKQNFHLKNMSTSTNCRLFPKFHFLERLSRKMSYPMGILLNKVKCKISCAK